MLLVNMTINGTVNYLSIDGHALVNNWRPRIIAFEAPSLSVPTNHGGYAQMTFGTITLNPVVFLPAWPPPVSCAISVYYTDTDEASKALVLSGTCYLNTFDRDVGVVYSIFGSSYAETIASATVYNASLNAVIASILNAITEITVVDTSMARVSSPNVTYTTSGVQLAITLASNIAAFYSHLIYVVGSTAYLVDMLLDNAIWTLDEFSFFAYPKYSYAAPVATVTDGTYSRFSAFPYGSSLSVTSYHTVEANIEAAMDNIIALENAPRVNLDVPMIAGNFPPLGRKIVIPDTGNIANLSSWVRARILKYDFLNRSINVEGEGAIAAA
jgi:hypothetical protein